MNKNIKYLVLLIILLIFSISCSYATNDMDDTGIDTTTDNVEINKDITKTQIINENLKTEKTVEINNYNSLKTELNDNEVNKTINIKKSTYAITDALNINNKGYTKNIIINGNGAIIDGSNTKTFLTIGQNNNVIINDLVIKNTKGTSQSGAIVVSNNAKLTLNNCNFTNDVSTGKGGAIANRGTTVINNCLFTSNSAAQGGAIWSTGEYGGSLQIENSKFISNKASSSNNNDKTGVIYTLSGGKVNIISNVFEKNIGRAIHNYKTTLVVSNNTFKNTVLNAPNDAIRGGVIDNYESQATITNNIFTNINVTTKSLRGGLLYNEIGVSSFKDNIISDVKVTASEQTDSLSGGIIFNRNATLTVSNNVFNNTNNGYKVYGGALYNNIGTLNVTGNTFNTKNTASNEIRGGAIYNDKTGNVLSKLYYGGNNFKNIQISGKVYNDTIYNLGTIQEIIVPIVKKATVVTVNQVFGVVGDPITFTAYVKDIDGNAVTGGNLVFKLNGKSLQTDGSFDGSSSPNKISVKNGVVTFTTTATKAIRGAKNISASYSGSNKYLANNTKDITTAEISLRKSSITITTSPSTQKQYETIKFIAKVTDITKNTKSSVPENNAESYVFFKLNGVTLKDSNGKQIQAKVNNGIATYDYVVPAGMAAISNDKTIRYYNVTAAYVNPNYYPDTKNTTSFNVLKSNITISNTNIVANMTSHELKIVGDIKDYKDNYVIGINKLNVKINGVTVSINNKTTVDVTNGKISLTISIPSNINNVKSVTLVTGARTAYEGYKTTISEITRV